MHLPMTFGTVISTLQRAGTQIVSDAAGREGKHRAESINFLKEIHPLNALSR